MSRRALLWTLGVGIPLAGLAIWIAAHTYWTDVTVPMPLRGEAATNPYYAAQRFVERLGGQATRDRTFSLPPADGVVVLTMWNWNLSPRRRTAIEQWVERGGRLVVDSSVDGGDEFAAWSGISFVPRRRAADTDRRPEGPCFRFEERVPGRSRQPFDRLHWICDSNLSRTLTTTRAVDWAMDETTAGRQALRVRVGRGRVTVINAEPFRFRQLFDGDHAWLLAVAAQLHPGDVVRFLSEGEYPPLLVLMWQTGAPVVVLVLVVLGLTLWRSGVRSGPLRAEDPPVRRSLAEQIRGTGRFALQYDGGEPLHAAAARALDDAARRRIPGWLALDAPSRVQTLAVMAGVAPDALDAALHDSRARAPHGLRDTLTLLETVRRALIREKRTGHGLS